MLLLIRRAVPGPALRITAARGMASSSPNIVDVDESNIMVEVMQSEVPVILDAHAAWCGPCLQLAPKLEAEVTAAKGRLRLAKLDTDQNQALAQQLRITSLPTVFGLHQGKIVDSFQGDLPPEAVKAFCDKLLALSSGGPAADEEDPIEAAFLLLDEEDHEGAKVALQEVLQSDEGKAAGSLEGALALAGLARAFVLAGDGTAAQEMVDVVKASYTEHVAEPRVQQALAIVAMAGDQEGAVDLEALRAASRDNPKDAEAHATLAQALVSRLLYEEALEAALLSVRRDRNWNDRAAQKLVVQILDALGDDERHETLKRETRRRLSNLVLV